MNNCRDVFALANIAFLLLYTLALTAQRPAAPLKSGVRQSAIYNIRGQYILRLQKGINIVNSRKLIVK